MSFSHTCLWTHQHHSDVYPECTLLSWLPLRGFLSGNTDLSVCETREFSIPLSTEWTTNQILAEIIPWVPLGECRPIHVSKVAASLKVDNQSLCDANRQSSQQILSPAVQALQLSCMAVKTVDYLGWIDHHRLLVNQSANMTKHSIILLFKLDFTDLDGIPPAHQDCRDDHKRGRKSLQVWNSSASKTASHQFLCTVLQFCITHTSNQCFTINISTRYRPIKGEKKDNLFFFLNQSLKQIWNSYCFLSS